MDPRSSSTTRRAPIPRPWLSEHHYVRPLHPQQHPPTTDYRYAPHPPILAPYEYHAANAGVPREYPMDLLRKPEWKVSWGKLSCCFCMRGQEFQQQNHHHHSSPSQKNNPFHSSAGANNNNNNGVGGIIRRQHNDQVPFPAFPILRRNSSSSFLVNENDVYPSGGSVSSFTESDTSNSESESGVIPIVRTTTFDSEELRRPMSPPLALAPVQAPIPIPIPHPSTPPPAPVTLKPHTIANRSRSAGLPPMMQHQYQQHQHHPPNNNNHSNPNHAANNPNYWGSPHLQPQQLPPPPARARHDTGDFTGIYSGTTNTSRHRRRQQYEFSTGSMKEIWQGKPVDEKLVLPSYVLCSQDQADSSALRPNDSGYISALEDSEDWGSTKNSGDGYYFYDGDQDEDEDFESASRFSSSQLQQRQLAAAERRRRKEERPPTSSSRARRTKSGGRRNGDNKDGPKAQRPPHKKPSSSSKNADPLLLEPTLVPVYLRKNVKLDNATEGNLVVSGWVAFSLGSSLEDRLRYEAKRIEAKNILYLRIVDDERAGARILLHSSSGAIVHEMHLQRDWMCESREISSRIGRFVNIRSRNSTSPMSSIANLLPVSLDDTFFLPTDNGRANSGVGSGEEELVSPQQFGQLRDRLFVAGKGKVYAPDEQHDAAMYIMFSLDALIKNCL